MNINLTLVIQGLAFFATAWVVMKFGWPLINSAIEERQKKIADGLAAAEEGQRALAQASEKQDAVIREARGEAAGIRDRAEKEYSAILDKAKADAIAEGSRQKSVAFAEIATEAHRTRQALAQHVADLAIKGAEHLIRKEIDPKVHQALMDDLIKEIRQ
ncbi:MAG: F0F1 ATP synthase subunit B [Lysobacterales bacterium]|nr:F0F1 ATP synthase subunit B [Xanthomonadales bacterium]MCB1612552.1 F0F1 ATP synthase subunit B [Xanthomonadales bacterium]MCP5473384.1 F0F1 ATP synthase subunit B [Rhodanobacteraceae bacterium]